MGNFISILLAIGCVLFTLVMLIKLIKAIKERKDRKSLKENDVLESDLVEKDRKE